MMNRNQTAHRSRLLAAMVSLLMLVVCTFTALPAHAANVPPRDNLSFTFNKYLVLNKGTKVPPVTFDFTIAAGGAVAAAGDMPAIYAGVGAPAITNAVFTPTDTTTEGLPTDSDADTADKAYATKEVTVTFDGKNFTAPGIYRYIITEESDAVPDGVTNDAPTTRTLDVYVEYANSSEEQLEVTHYVLHEETENNPNIAPKSKGFTNTYTSYALTLEKTVTGNQGDRDQYFKFTVDITDAVKDTVYVVDLDDADATPSVDGAQQSTMTVGEDGTVSQVYYLKHGQSIVIRGLTAKTQYTVTEKSYSADGYTTSYVLDSERPVESNTTGAKTMGAADHTVTFTNNKTGVVPTGILLDVAPYLLLVAAALAGFALLALGGKRRNRR